MNILSQPIPTLLSYLELAEVWEGILKLRGFTRYDDYKKQIFPKLLESPNVLPEDKQKIKELLKKPWNPYIRRHSALTEKSTILKEHVLRQHAGWSGSSQMHLKYLHYFGNESNESLLEAYGIVASGQQIDQLRPKQCPQCSESNKPEARFCAKCRMVLSYDAYSETLEKQNQEKSEMEEIRQRLQELTHATVNQFSGQLLKMQQRIEELERQKRT